MSKSYTPEDTESFQLSTVNKVYNKEIDVKAKKLFGAKYRGITSTEKVLKEMGISSEELNSMTANRLTMKANKDKLLELSKKLNSRYLLMTKPYIESLPKRSVVSVYIILYIITVNNADLVPQTDVTMQIIDLEKADVDFEMYYSLSDSVPSKDYLADVFESFQEKFQISKKTNNSK